MKRKSNGVKAVWQICCLNIAKHFYHVYLKMQIPAYVLTWQFPGCQHRWAGGDNFCIIGFSHLDLILAQPCKTPQESGLALACLTTFWTHGELPAVFLR